jgi:hypothetical protein
MMQVVVPGFWTEGHGELSVINLLDYPGLILVVSFAALWFADWLGTRLRARRKSISEEERPDFDVVLGAALTLLGLVIGFSFSMAINRFDLRSDYEEAEANAIETAYLRAELLPQEDSARIRELLRQYTDLRIQFYVNGHRESEKIAGETEQVHHGLWAAVSKPAQAQPTAVAALAVASVNDAIKSEGATREVWEDRIPTAAWGLMFGIALGCNVLYGYGSRRADWKLSIVLPLVVAVSLAFIADMNSPRGGFIHIQPNNLERLQRTLK